MQPAHSATAVGNHLPLLSSARAQRRIVAGGASVLGSSLVTSVAGLVFWLIAAHTSSRGAVGLAAGMIGLFGAAGLLGSIGIGTLLMGRLPLMAAGRVSLILTGAALAAAAGAVVAAVAALALSGLGSSLEAAGSGVPQVLLIATGGGLTAVALVLDGVALAIWPAGHVIRNSAYSAAKVAWLGVLTLVMAAPTGFAVAGAWIGGLAVSLGVLPRYIRTEDTRPRRADLVDSLRLLSELRGLAMRHHVVNVSAQASALVLPVLVAAMVSLEANADFYVAWMVATVLFMVPASLSTAVYPVTVESGANLQRNMRFSLSLALAGAAFGYLVLLLVAGHVIAFFGSAYSAAAVPAVEVLALGVFPLTIKGHYIALKRIAGRLGDAIPLLLGGVVLELAAAAAGSRFGVEGVCRAWLLAVLAEGAVMALPVWRSCRS